MEPVGFAIVSPARWGRLLLDAARESPLLEFAGVWSRSDANAADVVATYGGRSFESYEALLADPGVEAVLLPTPHFLHHPQTMAAFAAGKHVFVEKPIANSIAEAEEMVAESARLGLVLAVDHPGRRTGAARAAKAMLDAGDIGVIVSAVAVHGANVVPRDADDWKFSAEAVPGGPLDQLGPHYGDLMQYLLGPIRKVTGFYRSDVTAFSAPDAAIATFEFAAGPLGVYVTHQVGAYASSLTIYGTLGALQINRFGQELLRQDLTPTQAAQAAGTSWQAVPFEGPSPYTTALTEALDEFAVCIREGSAPEIGGPDGLSAFRVMRAVMDAQATGKTIVIPADG